MGIYIWIRIEIKVGNKNKESRKKFGGLYCAIFRRIVHILDGNSEHTEHAWGKKDFVRYKSDLWFLSSLSHVLNRYNNKDCLMCASISALPIWIPWTIHRLYCYPSVPNARCKVGSGFFCQIQVQFVLDGRIRIRFLIERIRVNSTPFIYVEDFWVRPKPPKENLPGIQKVQRRRGKSQLLWIFQYSSCI